MHSSHELESSFFEIALGGRPARLEDLFEDFGELDRLGVVMSAPCGAVGASALITATITAFYDVQRARSDEFFVYPDYFLFHVGRRMGDHARLDVWPPHKEVAVDADPDRLLEAINDRGITRLVVEDGAPGAPPADDAARASARARIATCLAYSPGGRVENADVRIASNDVTEGYVEAILDTEARIERLRAEGQNERADAVAARAGEVEAETRRGILDARSELMEGGVPVETYRRITLDEALGLLGAVRAPARAD